MKREFLRDEDQASESYSYLTTKAQMSTKIFFVIQKELCALCVSVVNYNGSNLAVK